MRGSVRGRRGENERSLEKRIEGVERWFLRKNEVLLKVNKKGEQMFLEVRNNGLRTRQKTGVL